MNTYFEKRRKKMIRSVDIYEPKTIEVILPFTNSKLQFIDIKEWDGQAIRMDIEFYKQLVEAYMRVTVTDDIRRKKKVMKKIIEINADLRRRTDFGLIYLLLEGNKGGITLIGQTSRISSVDDWDFTKPPWNKFSEIFIFSMKNESFPLSLRTTVEAKLLQNAMDNEAFTLLNEQKDTAEKIKLAEFQINEPDVVRYYESVRVVLKAFNILLLP